MDNNDYFEKLQKQIDIMKELRLQGLSIASAIIGKNLLKEDFFFCASVDRCINLIDGIITMLLNRNLTCAGALLRLQMDNCIRTYAPFIANNKDEVIDCIINGEPIKSKRSKDGNKLTDCYLKNEISKFDNQFSYLYKEISGFIHFSEKAFYQTIVECDNNAIVLQIGHEIPEKRNPVLIEVSDAFIHFVELHYKMLSVIADSKTKFDIKLAENNIII